MKDDRDDDPHGGEGDRREGSVGTEQICRPAAGAGDRTGGDRPLADYRAGTRT
ncbi:hypothetical protein KCH_03290 [Kitasatospora cheerisanensis KCTC 2395]|uniref:Uncharacterized protein n=1 Tax=Kitasatospora cheerisanensis KCTC 2395 TaxID=1348663 RepID=A0A066ZC67_9ACTN|nr:hypothetical protein KCH_03290 [Kitasatospora cheerisanensis KCTC 2395]